MILVLLLYVLFASTFTLGKLALLYLPPIFLVAVRMLAGGCFLLVYTYWFKRPSWKFEMKDVGYFAQISLFLMYIAFVSEFWAMQFVSAAKACLLYNLSPFITALLMYILLKSSLTKKQWMGLIIGFLGFIPIILSQPGPESLTPHWGAFSMPELFLIISVIASCYGWIVMKLLVSEKRYAPVMVNGVAMLWAGVLSLITSFVVEGKPILFTASKGYYGLSPYDYSIGMTILIVVLIILISQVVCFNLYAHLLKTYSVVFISFAGFTTPLFAALYDAVLFKEVVPMAFFVTVSFVAVGLYIFYQDELKGN